MVLISNPKTGDTKWIYDSASVPSGWEKRGTRANTAEENANDPQRAVEATSDSKAREAQLQKEREAQLQSERMKDPTYRRLWESGVLQSSGIDPNVAAHWIGIRRRAGLETTSKDLTAPAVKRVLEGAPIQGLDVAIEEELGKKYGIAAIEFEQLRQGATIQEVLTRLVNTGVKTTKGVPVTRADVGLPPIPVVVPPSNDGGGTTPPAPPPVETSPQAVSQLTQAELTNLLNKNVPSFTPQSKALGQVASITASKQGALTEEYQRKLRETQADLLERMGQSRTAEAGELATLQQTALPQFIKSQEPVIQEQLAQLGQATAESTAQQQAQLRKQYAASGRDVDLAQSGALAENFANIAGQGARTLGQGGTQFRMQALQTAKSDVDKLIEAAQGRYTQERDITGKSALMGQQAGMEAFSQSLKDIGSNISQQAQNEYSAVEQERNRQFAAAEAQMQRDYGLTEQEFKAMQADLDRQFSSREAKAAREFQGYENALNRTFQGTQANAERDFKGREAMQDRGFQLQMMNAKLLIEKQIADGRLEREKGNDLLELIVGAGKAVFDIASGGGFGTLVGKLFK